MFNFNTNENMNKKGITLIALVVTIIVLLMLVGITVSIALGDDGVIFKAKDSKEASRYSAVIDKVKIWEFSNNVKLKNKEIIVPRDKFAESLISENLIIENEYNSETGVITIANREIQLTEYLNNIELTDIIDITGIPDAAILDGYVKVTFTAGEGVKNFTVNSLGRGTYLAFLIKNGITINDYYISYTPQEGYVEGTENLLITPITENQDNIVTVNKITIPPTGGGGFSPEILP